MRHERRRGGGDEKDIAIHQQVGTLEVAVDDVADTMEPVHTQSCIFSHLEPLSHCYLPHLGVVVDEPLEIGLHELRDNHNLVGLRAGSQEQHNVWVEDV